MIKPQITYEKLADKWERFVGEKGAKDRASFLVKILTQKGCKKVLDAAMGIGLDTISIIKAGFEVTSNEIDKDFLKKAKQNATKAGVRFTVTSRDWRDLSDFKSNLFDAVFLLGNSLTHLFGRQNQLRALREFYRVLKEGGVLIIDERNYQDMLDCREEIMSNPLHKFSLRHKDEAGKATYSEDGGIKCIPTQISDDKIVLSYYDTVIGKWLGATIELYPFKKGELGGLMRETGFSKITEYSDFQEGYDPKADFYEYVVEKG